MQTSNIIKEMRLKSKEGIKKHSMTEFCNVENRKIYLCLHPAGNIGGYHAHEFYEINYVYKGSCINLIEDQSFNMEQGDAVIIHPDVFHLLYAYKECVVYNILIEKDWLEKQVGQITIKSEFSEFLKKMSEEDFYKYIFLKDKNERIKKIIDNLVKINANESGLEPLKRRAQVLNFIVQELQNPSESKLSSRRGTSQKKMIDILSYVLENYNKVNLEKVAEKFFYSKTHVCRLFLKNTGKTFSTAVIDMRIKRACVMLKTTQKSVAQISREVGYESVEYFQRLFKKRMGVSPGEYR